jgi:hypothetical protein
MSEAPPPSASLTVDALQNQLQEAMLEDYQLGQEQKRVQERIASLRTALNGVRLGQRFAEEQAAEKEPDSE